MARDNRTSVQLRDEQKAELEACQERLEARHGYAPTLGETIQMACESYATEVEA